MKDHTHSFIVHIWDAAAQMPDQDGKAVSWRGSIDYVGSNKRLYFQDLDSIVRFIQEQVEAYSVGNGSGEMYYGSHIPQDQHGRNGVRRYYQRFKARFYSWIRDHC